VDSHGNTVGVLEEERTEHAVTKGDGLLRLGRELNGLRLFPDLAIAQLERGNYRSTRNDPDNRSLEALRGGLISLATLGARLARRARIQPNIAVHHSRGGGSGGRGRRGRGSNGRHSDLGGAHPPVPAVACGAPNLRDRSRPTGRWDPFPERTHQMRPAVVPWRQSQAMRALWRHRWFSCPQYTNLGQVRQHRCLRLGRLAGTGRPIPDSSGRQWKLLLLFDTQNVPPIEQANVVIRTTKGELETGLHVVTVGTDPVNPFPIELVDDRTILTRGESDFPAFTLQLDGIAPALLDPRRAQAGFVLAYPHKATQTPSADAPLPVPSMPRGPAIDYLARDYGALRQMMMAELQALLPGWRGDAADMLTAIVEVLAYAGDDLSYFQDAVGTEAYLGTARLRKSIRRHARLVDYILNQGCQRPDVRGDRRHGIVSIAGRPRNCSRPSRRRSSSRRCRTLAVSSSLSGSLPALRIAERDASAARARIDIRRTDRIRLPPRPACCCCSRK